MRAFAIALLAAAAASALFLPSASAAVTVPEELCRPGEGGVCHWYTGDGNQCAYAHLGTMWAGACTSSEPGRPVIVCSTVELAAWGGWCWTGLPA